MNGKTFNFQHLKEFDNHKLVLSFFDKKTSLNGYIAIHKGNQSLPSFGATRIWTYENNSAAVKDVLRLSKLMSYKSALAELGYGGAKATIILEPNKQYNKQELVKAYARIVNYLGGKFITGADVGVDAALLKHMKDECAYIVGTKVDPVYYTALGVYYGIEASLKEVFGTESLENKSIAIQGLGKVGSALIQLLYKKGMTIYGTDISDAQVKRIKQKFPKLIIVSPNEIHKQNVDIFAPCALSNAINVRTISSLKCKIIAGSANLQLEDMQLGKLLHRLSILYAPDYVINAGGLIAVVTEYEKKLKNQSQLDERIRNIKHTLIKIYKNSKIEKKPTSIIADEIANMLFTKYNG